MSLLLAGSASADSALGGSQAAPSSQATRPADTRPAVVDYQLGVRINWRDHQVEVEGSVILREGGIELFACSPQTREHESIVCIDARPLHVYQALGLIGLTPGHPLEFDPDTRRVSPATGDPVEIIVQYNARGQLRREPIERWMRQSPLATQPVDTRDVPPLPWVFAGSFMTPDDAFAADFEGTVIAVVNFDTALIALPELHSDSNEELWLEPATERIPPLGTRCTLIFRPGPFLLSLDSLGRVHMGGEVGTLASVARSLSGMLSNNPGTRFRLTVDPQCPPESEATFMHLLGLLRIPDTAVARVQGRTSPRPVASPEALAEWVRKHAQPNRSGQSTQPAWQRSTRLSTDDLVARFHTLEARATNATEYFAQVLRDLESVLRPFDPASSKPAQNTR